MHGLHWPEPILSYLVVALAVGFPLVDGLSWILDVNAGEPTVPARGALRVRGAGRRRPVGRCLPALRLPRSRLPARTNSYDATIAQRALAAAEKAVAQAPDASEGYAARQGSPQGLGLERR